MIKILAYFLISLSFNTYAVEIAIDDWGKANISISKCAYEQGEIAPERRIKLGEWVFDFNEIYRPLISTTIKDGKYNFLYVSDSNRTVHGTIYSNLYKYEDLTKEIDLALGGKSGNILLAQAIYPEENIIYQNKKFIHVESSGGREDRTTLIFQSGNALEIVKLIITPSLGCGFAIRKDV